MTEAERSIIECVRDLRDAQRILLAKLQVQRFVFAVMLAGLIVHEVWYD